MRIFYIPATPPVTFTTVAFSDYKKLVTNVWNNYKEYDGLYSGYNIMVWNLDTKEGSFTY